MGWTIRPSYSVAEMCMNIRAQRKFIKNQYIRRHTGNTWLRINNSHVHIQHKVHTSLRKSELLKRIISSKNALVSLYSGCFHLPLPLPPPPSLPSHPPTCPPAFDSSLTEGSLQSYFFLHNSNTIFFTYKYNSQLKVFGTIFAGPLSVMKCLHFSYMISWLLRSAEICCAQSAMAID